MAYMRLGVLLIASGVIAQEQLDKALAVQKETHQRLGDVLMQNGFITERNLIDALQIQLGVEFVDLTAVSIPVELARYVPRNIARKFCVVPVKLVQDTLYLAMSDPLDFVAQEELKAAIALALENDRKVVFEAFVDGQEVECAVIGSDPAVATRPGEILAGAEFYTYDDKYKNGVSQTVIPAHLPEAKLDEVKTYAAMAYTALNCEGLARCDFFVEKNTGRVLINEINTFPGFTAISMYPKLMEHEGLPVPQLIDRLIALAVERTEKQHG